mgnify:CR=1 FL=1
MPRKLLTPQRLLSYNLKFNTQHSKLFYPVRQNNVNFDNVPDSQRRINLFYKKIYHAQKSTGPRTSEGKAAVSQNAVKHGLLARQDIISSESQAGFDLYRDQILAELPIWLLVVWP